MAANPSPERARRGPSPSGRIVYAGAITVAASMLLPWYGIAFSHGLSVTGVDSFGFAHAALLLTVAAAVTLVAQEARGSTLPRPLRSAELVVLAGCWATILTTYLIFDRPDELAGSTRIGVRMGAYVALAGCLAIAAGGVRMRTERPRPR